MELLPSGGNCLQFQRKASPNVSDAQDLYSCLCLLIGILSRLMEDG